ncbi:MotA/TolQ/ExbB proton channel [Pirellula staleyi DSM 6068]|uniref:MotA/TolQ/ExbB proton channel n=1 Tax=Pirellula staleyi (strain ATCC 27377 / DSM 6068 / ICPB 4128) TaxID=530564 RepID=D2R6T5_PIRSD|nr:MotA/TolQ/ExbB proton channel family protein [Pirellula staleyi]ADB17385.1 MotA/TolQ/ExbB proton channel [Pirellula staleyi DSM 6068]
MNIDPFFWDFISNTVYGALAIDALWGAYCIVVVYMRIGQNRFKSEKKQEEFLASLEAPLEKKDFESAAALCDGDRRALPQLALLAISRRNLGLAKVQELVVDRFQRDVLGDLDHRISWINNVIKTAPMLGLLGTVLGMMAAFGKLASEANVKPDQLASDISFALITTAIGLAIAIPATICVASINVRIRKMEDMVFAGLNDFLDRFASAVTPVRK